MRLSEGERAANREAFKAMGPAQKAEYIFAYYKLPLVIALVVVVAVGSVAHRALTHKNALLYVAFANAVPPSEVDDALTAQFVAAQGEDPRRVEIPCYRDLYVSNSATTADHQYAYASKLKLMAAIEGEQLDVVLMNQEAYDLLSGSGYLLDLGSEFGESADLRTNVVVLETNQVEVDLGEADALEATTVDEPNALEVTDAALLRHFSGNEPLYLGVIANSPRQSLAFDYLRYVSS